MLSQALVVSNMASAPLTTATRDLWTEREEVIGTGGASGAHPRSLAVADVSKS